MSTRDTRAPEDGDHYSHRSTGPPRSWFRALGVGGWSRLFGSRPRALGRGPRASHFWELRRWLLSLGLSFDRVRRPTALHWPCDSRAWSFVVRNAKRARFLRGSGSTKETHNEQRTTLHETPPRRRTTSNEQLGLPSQPLQAPFISCGRALLRPIYNPTEYPSKS